MMRGLLVASILLALVLIIPSVNAAPPSFVLSFGSEGSGNGQFESTFGIAADDSGNIYTTDFTLNRVQKFSRDGNYVTSWGGLGAGLGQFNSPQDLGVASDGSVYVSDFNNNRIQRFDRNGGYLNAWPVLGPVGLDVHPNGNVYVYSDGQTRINVYNPAGALQFSFFAPNLTSIKYLAIDFRGFVYLIGDFQNKVWKFTSEGNQFAAWGGAGDGFGDFDFPRGVDTDDHGNVYVCDGNNGRIQQFDSTGTFLTAWGEPGSGPGEFLIPVDVAWVPGDSIYVFDQDNEVELFLGTDCPPVVEVSSPAGPQILIPGEMISIEWNAGDDVGVRDVDIAYTAELKLYGSAANASGSPANFYEINQYTGVSSLIGPVGFDYVTAMEAHPNTGILYACAERSGDGTIVLITIDPATGVGTEIGPCGVEESFTDLSMSETTGKLYGHVTGGGGPNLIYEINILTGNASLLGMVNQEGVGGGLEFSKTGALSLALTQSGDGNLYDVNLGNGAASNPREISFAGLVQVPRVEELDSHPFGINLICLYRDNTTLMRLGMMQMGSFQKPIEHIGMPGGSPIALAYVPSPCVSIATTEPNDGQFTWTVPELPTNVFRIKVIAHDSIGQEGSDMNDGYLGINYTTAAGPPGSGPGPILTTPVPNPFSTGTAIHFSMSSSGRAHLAVFDVQGRRVRTLVEGEQPSGTQTAHWDGLDQHGVRVAAGFYILRLETADGVSSRGVSVIR